MVMSKILERMHKVNMQLKFSCIRDKFGEKIQNQGFIKCWRDFLGRNEDSKMSSYHPEHKKKLLGSLISCLHFHQD